MAHKKRGVILAHLLKWGGSSKSGHTNSLPLSCCLLTVLFGGLSEKEPLKGLRLSRIVSMVKAQIQKVSTNQKQIGQSCFHEISPNIFPFFPLEPSVHSHTQSKGGVNPPCFFFGSLPFSTGPLPKVWCSKHPRPESPPKNTIPNRTCRLVRYLEELSLSVGYGTCIWGFQSYFLGELALRFP